MTKLSLFVILLFKVVKNGEERLFGNFRRQFTLDEEVDPNKVKAEFKNGILEIELPNLKSQSSKTISVKS